MVTSERSWVRTPFRRRSLAGRMLRRRALGVLLVVAAFVCPPVAPARADGDPASDALISQNVFYPYSSPVPQAAQTRLNGVVSTAHRDGVPLKVAIIARPGDLGSVSALYGDPQRYAEFLDTEISYQRRIPLLVVMPSGFGVEGLSASTNRTIRASPRPAGSSGADLAQAATTAVTRALTGSPHRAVAASGSSGVTGRMILLLALILAAILVTAALVLLRVFAPPTRV